MVVYSEIAAYFMSRRATHIAYFGFSSNIKNRYHIVVRTASGQIAVALGESGCAIRSRDRERRLFFELLASRSLREHEDSVPRSNGASESSEEGDFAIHGE